MSSEGTICFQPNEKPPALPPNTSLYEVLGELYNALKETQEMSHEQETNHFYRVLTFHAFEQNKYHELRWRGTFITRLQIIR